MSTCRLPSSEELSGKPRFQQLCYGIASVAIALSGCTCRDSGTARPADVSIEGGSVSTSDLPPLCDNDEHSNESGCFIIARHPDSTELLFAHSTHPASAVTKHTATMSTTTATLAGITTWSINVAREDDGGFTRWTLSEFSPSTGTLVQQHEYTPSANDTLRVVARKYNGGATPELHEFEVPRIAYQPPRSPGLALPAPGDPPMKNINCDGEAFSILHAHFYSALMQGFNCMRDKKRPDIGTLVLIRNQDSPTTMRCGHSNGEYEAAMDPGNNLISIDYTLLSKSDTFIQRTLWHEWLHTIFPRTFGHNDLPNDLASTESDRVYACTSLCFDGPRATRCACAKCLGTDPCDKRCAGLSACTKLEPECDGGLEYQADIILNMQPMLVYKIISTAWISFKIDENKRITGSGTQTLTLKPLASGYCTATSANSEYEWTVSGQEENGFLQFKFSPRDATAIPGIQMKCKIGNEQGYGMSLPMPFSIGDVRIEKKDGATRELDISRMSGGRATGTAITTLRLHKK